MKIIITIISFTSLILTSCSYGKYYKSGNTIKFKSYKWKGYKIVEYKAYDSTGKKIKYEKFWKNPENPTYIYKDVTIEWTDSLKIKTTQGSTGKRDTIYVKEI